MSDLKGKGKYYWVKTPAGKEVAFKRNSGKWELCGINNDEDCKDAILEVYGEVANGVPASDSDLHLQHSLLDLDGKTIPVTFHVSKYKPKIDIDFSNDC